MTAPFDSSRPAIRVACAGFALAATFATCLFINGLARSYSFEAQQLAKAKPMVVAQAKKAPRRN